MAEFTPWRWFRTGCQIRDTQDRKVAEVAVSHVTENELSLRGNLFAAAPDFYAAALALEEAETAWANCSECGGDEMPELCPACFPLFDNARLMRRAALRKADGKES